MSTDKKLLYPTRLDIAVRWGEMDALGHVNNIIYYRYFEEIRIVYFDKIKLPFCSEGKGLGPILAASSCQFKQAVTYPDTLTVAASVSKIGNSSMTIDYQIYSNKLESIVSTGSSVIVLINYTTGEKVRISDEVREQIKFHEVTENSVH